MQLISHSLYVDSSTEIHLKLYIVFGHIYIFCAIFVTNSTSLTAGVHKMCEDYSCKYSFTLYVEFRTNMSM
jgi:hypothetical protein